MITFIESGNRIATENFEIGEIYTITFTNGNYKTMCCIGVGSNFVMFQYKLPNALFCLTLGTAETVSTIEIGGGGSGTMNYNELENKPQINGVILIGNKTAADLNLASTADLSGKQDTLTETQLTAVNSGITSSLVTQIGTNTTAISEKQDQLSAAQLTAVNSGITSSLVTQIGTNKNNISKFVYETLTINLGSATFSHSAGGIYYAGPYPLNSVATVLGYVNTGIASYSDTWNIFLQSGSNGIYVFANTGSFTAGAIVTFRIFGLSSALS